MIVALTVLYMALVAVCVILAIAVVGDAEGRGGDVVLRLSGVLLLSIVGMILSWCLPQLHWWLLALALILVSAVIWTYRSASSSTAED